MSVQGEYFMLVRLLVVVLMIAGPIPVGTCTCAVARTPSASIDADALERSSHKDCHCGHRSHATGKLARSMEIDASHNHAVGSVPIHPDRHDRDCPAVSPRSVVAGAITTSVAHLSADLGLDIRSRLESSGAVRNRIDTGTEPRPIVCAVPRYILLLTIRN